MFPILILRCEVVCIILLVFLFFTSRTYHLNESKAFDRILRFALLHVAFDIATVLTVNHLDTVPSWVNWLCHVIFYLSAMFFATELANYAIGVCYPARVKKAYAFGHILISAYIVCLSFLDIEYESDIGTYSSTGPAAIVGYGLAFAFFLAAIVVIFSRWKHVPRPIKSALIPMMLVLMITEICQVIWRSVLFTGGAVTIVTVGVFFSLENPVAVFQRKALTDALTGVQSRSSYEEDMERYDRRFREKPNEDYVFVFCDINDLRSVNNRFGHSEGDNYISLIASSITRCLQHSTAVYRIGGDEFLILYTKTNVAVIEQEITALHEACTKASDNLQYTAAVAVGYARSSANYDSLRDVVKTADYAMYQNKKSSDKNGASSGTNLNYAGLTDKIFDAICASTDRNYPFITNLNTGVTRIAPGWKEYFGLESDFFSDFIGVWKDRIHPDDYEGYMEDVLAVINGHRKYHHFDYHAKKADGEYVRVSCHGSVYRDSGNGTSYFTGYIINFGTEDNIDSVTGLENFDRLTSRVCTLMDNGKTITLLKLKLNNFAHVNMLYDIPRVTKYCVGLPHC